MHKNMRMSTTLRLFFILVVIIPVILISYIILHIYKRDILEQNKERSLQTSEALAYSVSQEISRMSGLFASIGVDRDVFETVSAIHHSTGIEKQAASYNLKILIEKYTASVSGRVLSVNFFFDNNQSYSYLKNVMTDENNIRGESWYKETLNARGNVRFLGMIPNLLYGNYNLYLMAAAFSPQELHSLSSLEMILFTFESGAFDHILQSRDNSESILHIVSDDHQIIASNTIVDRGSLITNNWISNLDSQSKGAFVDNENGGKHLVTYARVDNTDWFIVQMIPFSSLMEKYNNVNSFVWLLAVFIILALVLISFYFVSNVTKPLSELLRQIVRVTGGDLSARCTESGSLEMVRLGHSFNLMTAQIQDLLEQHEQQETEKRKAEFAALQSQINPHFLINTLNSIKFMALISKADNIRSMTHALTRMLASSFNRGGLLITVEEEIDLLKHYLYIMEIRFGRPIETDWDIGPNVTRYYLLKLLLQPILENSIIHGLKEVNYPAKIQISIRQTDNDLLIAIADNGVGMPEELFADPQGKSPIYSFSGMGNKNVHNRIQLHYGRGYGLHYEPHQPNGTKVTIRLPIITEPDESVEP
ncbi:sensor histidine kinase [Paenibacillus nanensis]|uniref:Sensor histidine kinase n=1 Tax=Paenibacillus nanensis TaxID=393251 RepID=A0A3A1UW15_9BACL|nr:sensor histidine kinase [Paenibacillus nanensis]RIX52385.1 sensor histidine kinase [Paenibacillus nanensis]